MKILVFTTLFPNSRMPQHATFIKARVAALAKMHEIQVVAPVPYFPPKWKVNEKWSRFSQVPLEEEIGGIKVYHPRYLVIPKIGRALYGLLMYLSLYGFVRNLRRSFDFDLIDAHFLYPDGVAAVLLGRRMRKKTILNARGTDLNWYPRFPAIRAQIRSALKKADAVTVVTETLREKAVELGIDRGKVTVIPNGVDTGTFCFRPRDEAKRTLGLPDNRRVILAVGHVLEAKGFHFLIEALRHVRQQDTDLVIIGGGEYKEKLLQLAAEHHLQERVKFPGERPQSELALWYAAADMFCLTSLREGRPNVVMEALACGTPVVSMNKWGLSRIVNLDKGILLDSYGSAGIARAIDEILQRHWDRRAISESMKEHTWARTAEQVDRLMAAVISHPSRRPCAGRCEEERARIPPLSRRESDDERRTKIGLAGADQAFRRKAGGTQKDILFFSSDDWDSGLKTSKYHLSTRLARGNRVFFINSLSLRTPTLSQRDLTKLFAKLKGYLRGAQKVKENLYVYTPLLVPFQRFSIIRRLNKFLLLAQFRWLMARYRLAQPEIWTFLPNTVDLVTKLPRRKLVYYCVDDMSAFKGVPQEIIQRQDEMLTKKADVTFSVSEELFNKKRLLNPNSFYSPHGADFDLFNRADTDGAVKKPEDLAGIPEPIIGFYGLISGDWIDYKLVEYLAQNRPAWSFVFIGKIDQRPGEELPRQDNIYYLPVKPYEELYRYSNFFDVAILPFNINPLTTHSHPLKILEYLSAGRPVVCVDIPETKKYAQVIAVASSYKDFLEKIETCLNNDDAGAKESRVNFASRHSWDKQFDEIQEIISRHI
ncbi:MAG: glycosyltransferase [Candidatus Omnitrophica bacterium]|nr:glycosyltransferase [Candidatus Omnitrophota bacterium]